MKAKAQRIMHRRIEELVRRIFAKDNSRRPIFVGFLNNGFDVIVIIKMSLLKWLKPSQNRLVKFGAVTPGLVYCTAKIGVSFWIQTIFNNFFIFSPKMNGSNRTMNSIEASLNLLILSM
ncbi:MAG: hypothetical protein ACK45H_04005 [Bacteroidota bacterium]